MQRPTLIGGATWMGCAVLLAKQAKLASAPGANLTHDELQKVRSPNAQHTRARSHARTHRRAFRLACLRPIASTVARTLLLAHSTRTCAHTHRDQRGPWRGSAGPCARPIAFSFLALCPVSCSTAIGTGFDLQPWTHPFTTLGLALAKAASRRRCGVQRIDQAASQSASLKVEQTCARARTGVHACSAAHARTLKKLLLGPHETPSLQPPALDWLRLPSARHVVDVACLLCSQQRRLLCRSCEPNSTPPCRPCSGSHSGVRRAGGSRRQRRGWRRSTLHGWPLSALPRASVCVRALALGAYFRYWYPYCRYWYSYCRYWSLIVGFGSLIVGIGTLIVGFGTLIVGIGNVIVGIGTLIVGIGTVIVGIGTLTAILTVQSERPERLPQRARASSAFITACEPQRARSVGGYPLQTTPICRRACRHSRTGAGRAACQLVVAQATASPVAYLAGAGRCRSRPHDQS